MSQSFKKIVLTRPVQGVPDQTNFRVVDDALPTPGEGQFVVEHKYISLDPYQRPAMSGRPS